jgi:glutamine amidotransferase
VSDIVIVDYGAGNTHSVTAALRRCGHVARLSKDPIEVLEADLVVLPGVGSASQAMTYLNAHGTATALRERFIEDRPLLGICLGLQLAMTSSEEDGGVATLGLVEGVVRRIADDRVPRIGWATVEPWDESFYFAHSYSCITEAAIATSEGYVAAVRAGSFLGVQFHPEKSGPVGERWLASCLSPA